MNAKVLISGAGVTGLALAYWLDRAEIGADGVYSNVRKLCFDDEAAVVFPLEVVLALFLIPNLIDLKDWQLGYRENNVGYVIYPNLDQSELRIGVGFEAPQPALARGEIDAQKRNVAEQCAYLKGEFPRFIDAMKTTDQFYYNELAQVCMPSWFTGRVVLAGDAGYCASPFSGQGTSLGLVAHSCSRAKCCVTGTICRV
ncbi:putative oxidoreductase [Candidatus Burkholderia humilis]|nr:putative oxidoreductase [Candidatus Burkholderia humilis]